MFHRESLEDLNGQLESVDAQIAEHPFSSEPVKRAHAVVKARGQKDNAAVERELADAELPGLAELGEIQVKGTVSWWRLHRDRNKIEKKIKSLTR